MEDTTPTPCPYQHIHGDKHQLFLQTGRVYCECEVAELEKHLEESE